MDANRRKTTAGGKRPSRKYLVEEYLRENKPEEITAEVLREIRRHVTERLGGATASERYLLDLLERTSIPIVRELGGLPADLRERVHFHDRAAAEASLREMQREYEAGDRHRAEDVRRAVLRGRERLELLLRRPALSGEKRAEKVEIREWFRVWLENPALFDTWIELRKRELGRQEKRPG